MDLQAVGVPVSSTILVVNDLPEQLRFLTYLLGDVVTTRSTRRYRVTVLTVAGEGVNVRSLLFVDDEHKVIVEKHGGTISFDTREGAGTTPTLTNARCQNRNAVASGDLRVTNGKLEQNEA